MTRFRSVCSEHQDKVGGHGVGPTSEITIVPSKGFGMICITSNP